jgi:hypothetical protein
MPISTSAAAISREALYEEIWVEPMTIVSARYGVSGSYLARVCVDLDVPRPPRGYWAKLEVGKAGPRPLLPNAKPGAPLEWSRSGSVRRMPHAPLQGPTSEKSKRARLNRVSPERHRLTSGVREHFEAGWVSDAGYLRPRKRVIVDVFVSKSQLSRALNLASELFLTLEDRGHEVDLSSGHGYRRADLYVRKGQAAYDHYNHRQPLAPDRPTIVLLGTVAIGLTIYEIGEEVEFRYLKGEYVRVSQLPISKRPYESYTWTTKRETVAGLLAVRAYSPYPGTTWAQEWTESKPGDLESRLRSIRSTLEAAAPSIVPLVQEAQRKRDEEIARWKAQHEVWEREEQLRKQREAIKESREQLLSIVDAWAVARNIEDFFADADRRSRDLSSDEREAIVARLEQARKMLGGTDALGRLAIWKSPEQRMGQPCNLDNADGEDVG